MKLGKLLKYKYMIFSESPDALVQFYTEGMGFQAYRKVDVPFDYGYFINLGENLDLFIGKHSEVNGKNRDVLRHIFDLCVNSVDETWERIKDIAGLEVIAEPFDAPCSRVATFADPEGNCWQLSEPMNCE